jgi:hypothetical protein
MLVLMPLVLAACATARPKLEPGRGLFWDYAATRLENMGYPNSQMDYLSSEWGQLYDEDGIPYGPGTFVRKEVVLGSELMTTTDDYYESRWVRMYRTGCCAEDLTQHILETFDLHWYDLSRILAYKPDRMIEVYSPADLDEYRKLAGNEFWNTHAVINAHIVLEPAGILFRRKIYGRAGRAAMAQVFLDLKCHGRLPMWFREGLSSYLAEEGNDHLAFVNEFRMAGKEVVWPPATTLLHVSPLVDRENGRIARYNAFLMLWHLAERWGFDRILNLLNLVEAGRSFEEASTAVYGVGEAGLLQMLDPQILGEPTTTLVVPTS